MDNVHAYLYNEPARSLQASQNLCEISWGEDLNLELQDVYVDEGIILKYLPKKYLDTLEISQLGYSEVGLLVEIHFPLLLAASPAKPKKTRGSSDAYHFLVFDDYNVKLYPLDIVDLEVFPAGTWALSGSNEETELPCHAFLIAARHQSAWIVQTTSPPGEKWKEWRKRRSAVMFVMKHFIFEEMTALSKVLSLNAGDLQRNYGRWGPSARTCVQLSREPAGEFAHEEAVKETARRFVKELRQDTICFAGLDMIRSLHVPFSVRPVGDSRAKRRIPDADIATDRIRAIISCAAAAATTYQRGRFYRDISRHEWFNKSAGSLFKKLVLTWLSSDSEAGTLLCTSAGWPDLPVQATVSTKHSAEEGGFTVIAESLPTCIRDGRDWCHVFITDDEWTAQSLRDQKLSNLPDDIRVYSGVYDVGQRDIISGISWALDEDNQRVLENMDVDEV
ncbi:hypothetical protein EI94DRAFT_1920824 [Lactarius quietus]|nr:hypothetical protein EI94DRAFT_1920824 [Lactarius quietus]